MADQQLTPPSSAAAKEVKFEENVQTHTIEMPADSGEQHDNTDTLRARLASSGNDGEPDEEDDLGDGPLPPPPGSRPVTRSAGARMPSVTGSAARFIRTPLTSGRPDTANTLQDSFSDEEEVQRKKDITDDSNGYDTVDNKSESDSFLITELKYEEHEKSLIPWDELKDKDIGRKQEQDTVSDHEEDYDTDLEEEHFSPEHDPTGRTNYLQICERLGVVPASYFARHITDSEITMKNYGLGAKGARAIAKCMKQIVTCEKLDLSANWMGEEGGRYMAKMVKENDYISELFLADNFFGHDGSVAFCKMLLENVTIRNLDLSGNAFTDNEAEYFAETFEENKYLKHLNISRNYFGDLSGVILGPAIASNDICESLDLSWNQIRGKGAVAIARGLKENIRIKVCNLAWNGLGPAGGVAIADALTANEALTELDISGNRIDSYAAELIGKALAKNDLIKILKMGNNPISTNSLVTFLNNILNSDTSVLEHFDITDVPVEYEYLRTVIEVKKVRPNFTEIHGPVMRSGNTNEDVGKPSKDPKILTSPMVVLREHIVINDVRILEILQNYDTDKSFSVTQEDFASALKDLGVPFEKQHLIDLAERLGTGDGKIYYGDILQQLQKGSKQNSTNENFTTNVPIEA